MGDQLTKRELAAVGLPDDTFALRVKNSNYGAHLSGIRRGDIILGAGNRTDFDSPRSFFHWCELMRLAKKDIKIDLIRRGSRMRLMVVLGYMSYTSIESSPQIRLGFIAQELAGDRGLRVGNVVDGSGAERAGLSLGDRIALVDGQPIGTFAGLRAHMDTKSPGDMVAFAVQRGDELLRVTYSLVDEQQQRSSLARLSSAVRKVGQEILCTVELNLARDSHIYSAHRAGFGLPTQLQFRGTGYELVGELTEPKPKAVRTANQPTMWIHEGSVQLTQRIRVTDPEAFHLVLELFAQVCDRSTCHELRAVVESDGSSRSFLEFVGPTKALPVVKLEK